MGYDPITKEAVPRRYDDCRMDVCPYTNPKRGSLVRSLEAKVLELENQLQAYRAAPEHLPFSTASRLAQATISFGVASRRSFLRSKVSPTLLFRPSCPPLAVVRKQQDRSDTRMPSGTEEPMPNQEPIQLAAAGTLIDLNSVPFSAIKQMVQNYVDVHRPQYPCVSATLVNTIVDRTRCQVDDTFFHGGHATDSGVNHFEYFVLFLILAISAMTLTWKAEHQARAASETFYSSAIKHLQAVEDNNDIQALQISLLLAHYAHLCPERLDNWTCIMHAVRVVLDLGLHRGSPEALDPAEQRQWRQLFWVTYGMERSLCGNLRLPLSFSEQSITTPVSFSVTFRFHLIDGPAARFRFR